MVNFLLLLSRIQQQADQAQYTTLEGSQFTNSPFNLLTLIILKRISFWIRTTMGHGNNAWTEVCNVSTDKRVRGTENDAVQNSFIWTCRYQHLWKLIFGSLLVMVAVLSFTLFQKNDHFIEPVLTTRTQREAEDPDLPALCSIGMPEKWVTQKGINSILTITFPSDLNLLDCRLDGILVLVYSSQHGHTFWNKWNQDKYMKLIKIQGGIELHTQQEVEGKLQCKGTLSEMKHAHCTPAANHTQCVIRNEK